MASPLRDHWLLDPEIVFLNHGSFGACPKVVLEQQSALRAELEREPVRFMLERLEPALDDVRSELATRFGLEPEGVAFVPNATTAVATVLGGLQLAPGDEVLVTNHTYAACRNVVARAASRSGARLVTADLPFPVAGADEIVERLLRSVSDRTRLALVDHVTSPTALVLPVAEIVRRLAERGVDVLVDGAHAPGMLPLDLDALGAAYYAANFHKWCCAPKGAGMLYVRRDRRERVHPLVASHGMTSPRSDRERFRLEFDWTGTQDPTPYLSLPRALRFLDELTPGGLAELMRQNHELAVRARAHLLSRLELEAPCPEAMLGSMATIRLSDGGEGSAQALNQALFTRHQIELFVHPFPTAESRVVRLCAAPYNDFAEFERLADALCALLGR